MTNTSTAQAQSQTTDIERRLQAAEARAARAEADAKRAEIEDLIRAQATQHDIIPSAVRDIAHRALKDKNFKPEKCGDWLTWLKADAPFYFGSYQDAAAAPRSYETIKNPWSREHWSLTDQGRVCKVSMDEAHRLARLAGSYLGATRPPAPK